MSHQHTSPLGGPHVVDLEGVGASMTSVLGGKGANLGELERIDGVRVPRGFCVTTSAFREIVTAPAVRPLLEQLTRSATTAPATMAELTAAIRAAIEGADVPGDVAAEIGAAVARYGDEDAYAVRSSATAEDLPSASFAGQHDTYLNVFGGGAIVQAVRRCWASLFTDRAVAYRQRNGIDHQRVDMAVVVQHLVTPQVSGVLFTADPVSGNRRIAVVEATTGLGESLVSGSVDVDTYRVRDGSVIERRVATKPVATRPAPGGGTREEPNPEGARCGPTLTDDQVLELVDVGRRVEAHFGRPQDIEWCLADDGLHLVQSRPITTLFPLPAADDDTYRVYVSVGHGQMMTDPMTPLGLSVWQLTSPAPMRIAGSRLFVDVTGRLAVPELRAATLEIMGRSDPLMRDALETVLGQGLIANADDAATAPPPAGTPTSDPDPALVDELVDLSRRQLAELRDRIATRSGTDLLDLIRADLDERRGQLVDPRSHGAVMAGFEASWWLNDHLEEWLGEKGITDALSQAAPGNVTADMGLALLDVADAIRPRPDVVAALRRADDDTFFDELDRLPEAGPARDAIRRFLEQYGMRCVGEIDIARPRWRERPTTLVPAILANVESFEPGERARRVEAGLLAAQDAKQRVLRRLRGLPDGDAKAAETERMIERLRNFIGYREFPKYALVSRYAIYKDALLAEASRLVDGGVIDTADDIFFLTFDELHATLAGGRADRELLQRRRETFRADAALRAPRVLTSDGEMFNGAYRRDDIPAGALVGLGISGGTVVGRARVVHDMAAADLQPGDILVTPHTDPSWTPVFVTIAGLVTEVGGLTTHGAVIAREYGLIAVVGVEGATELIADGQRIRVHGTDGYVELLSDQPKDEHLRRNVVATS